MICSERCVSLRASDYSGLVPVGGSESAENTRHAASLTMTQPRRPRYCFNGGEKNPFPSSPAHTTISSKLWNVSSAARECRIQLLFFFKKSVRLQISRKIFRRDFPDGKRMKYFIIYEEIDQILSVNGSVSVSLEHLHTSTPDHWLNAECYCLKLTNKSWWTLCRLRSKLRRRVGVGWGGCWGLGANLCANFISRLIASGLYAFNI